jgi:hypothetical protein
MNILWSVQAVEYLSLIQAYRVKNNIHILYILEIDSWILKDKRVKLH